MARRCRLTGGDAVSYGDHVTNGYHHDRVLANGIYHHVASCGDGPPLLLLHGWPHTWFVWHRVAPLLARHHRVIIPDLRGLGESDRSAAGYDLDTLAGDAAAVLDAFGARDAAVVAMDLGVAVAWMLAARHRLRVRALVLMEGLVGRLPGAEQFLANGPPWWWGFHAAAPALAETVLAGNFAAYVGWFLRDLTDETARETFLHAYRDNLGLAHYRAMPGNAALVAATDPPTDVPTLAISGGVVGDALAGQLAPISRALTTARIPHCGHVIPLDQPDALAACISPFIAPR